MSIPESRIERCYQTVRSALLSKLVTEGEGEYRHWVGRLSASALSTATAVMALELVRRKSEESAAQRFQPLIDGGLKWLAAHQNDDGGWGDTVKSLSNISTTMLAHAVFHASGTAGRFKPQVDAAKTYINKVGGVDALLRRYGTDRTFSIPILTHCALAGLVDWKHVIPLPFELACIPARFYKAVRLPVVSYALPALIAIGQVRFFHKKPWNPISRVMRKFAVSRSLKVLERVQPPNGGFLEAAPLTSFVTMSLAAMGLVHHPVTCRSVEFLCDSVLEDGSWPIDTNLSTWVTTLSVNALREDVPNEERPAIRGWLLDQQYREQHPYTNADPGGWAWTDLPGGVPDCDDTPGAILALLKLRSTGEIPRDECEAIANAIGWLLDLQNRDMGWPTFCRGWGTQPFDRSAPDISAHVIRALTAWLQHPSGRRAELQLRERAEKATATGFEYLQKSQRYDGSWRPLWFGNQFAPDDANPTYGTSRVLAAYRDANRIHDQTARRGLDWLVNNQNRDDGWGGTAGVESSVEETALAVEILLFDESSRDSASRGLEWLMDRVDAGTFEETTPIGFYFAKLWYFEDLYPVSFTAAALNRAIHTSDPDSFGNRSQQRHEAQLSRVGSASDANI